MIQKNNTVNLLLFFNTYYLKWFLITAMIYHDFIHQLRGEGGVKGQNSNLLCILSYCRAFTPESNELSYL